MKFRQTLVVERITMAKIKSHSFYFTGSYNRDIRNDNLIAT
jgi:hypothetical protein